jgi:ferredoxin-NADP reductase
MIMEITVKTSILEEHIVKILDILPLTHNVIRFRVEKPEGYRFVPGQATEVSINAPVWSLKKRPFTFTCLNTDPFLEFSIKIYPDRHGVTDALGKLETGAELIIRDVWGAINYKGPGVFIAGGAGVTPFIAIFRQLYQDNAIGENRLIFSNRTLNDIILYDEFRKMLGKNFINTLTREKLEGFENRRIDEQFLKDHITDFSGRFYLCGPGLFVEQIRKTMMRLGATTEGLVIED